eukprot:6241552-Pyramimonas_sp.AAC.2
MRHRMVIRYPTWSHLKSKGALTFIETIPNMRLPVTPIHWSLLGALGLGFQGGYLGGKGRSC